MSDVKFYHISGGSVSQMEGQSVSLEKSLQTLIEDNAGMDRREN